MSLNCDVSMEEAENHTYMHKRRLSNGYRVSAGKHLS